MPMPMLMPSIPCLIFGLVSHLDFPFPSGLPVSIEEGGRSPP